MCAFDSSEMLDGSIDKAVDFRLSLVTLFGVFLLQNRYNVERVLAIIQPPVSGVERHDLLIPPDVQVGYLIGPFLVLDRGQCLRIVQH